MPRLLSFSHWRRTKHQGPEQRNLYTAPLPAQAPESCFLFIPCCWDSMGRNSAPLPHCSNTNVYSPLGLLSGSAREGETQGLLTKSRLCAGALRVHRAWTGRTGANLSHTEQHGTEGKARSGLQSGVHRGGGRRQGLIGSGAFWVNQSCSPVLWSRGVLCAMG